MFPGLLPIFLHGCKTKSGSGLGVRLTVQPLQDNVTAKTKFIYNWPSPADPHVVQVIRQCFAIERLIYVSCNPEGVITNFVK